MPRVALRRVGPAVRIKAEEKLNILGGCQYVNCSGGEGVNLTAVAYVKEQYISPKKKSRNSTGYNPARSKRHCLKLAFLPRVRCWDNSHVHMQTISDSD